MSFVDIELCVEKLIRDSIIGRTSNPFKRSFSSGSSSGGEGAFLGFHASPLGIGSDLGGSIRRYFSLFPQSPLFPTQKLTPKSPSAYQGLWSLRPSSGRVPYLNILNSMEGQESLPSVVGPMSHSPLSLELFMKTVVNAKPWLIDLKCHPIPWREYELDSAMNNKKLRIGVMHWDGIALPQPPVRRAMKTLEAALVAAGHEVFSWRIDQGKAL